MAPPGLARDRRVLEPGCDRGQQLVRAALDERGVDAPDLAERLDVTWVALGELEQRRVLQHLADGAILVGGGALAPGCQPLRHGPRLRFELAHPGQPLPHGLRVPLVGGRLQPPAFLHGPVEAARAGQSLLDHVRQLQQVGHVLGRVAQLLAGQRPRVPAGVAGGLAHTQAEHRAEQVAVAGLGALADEAGGDLGVEDVGQMCLPGTAQDRHVLAPGVQHDLHLGVRQQLRQRAHIDAAVQPVDQDRADAGGLARILHGHLRQAQERAVATLRHELGVDPEPAAGARERSRGLDVGGIGKSVHDGTLSALQPASAGSRTPRAPCNFRLILTRAGLSARGNGWHSQPG